ncbi:SMI1/KNR4 family protein [Streptomyces sp. NPDC127114]|uniref:SMI1/KNR4 family protein n=1 Tax=Streptomyces sp. NPDC127114 TaxID=3345366 RepID=UPI003624C4C3
MGQLEEMLSVVGDECGDEVDWAAVERAYGVHFPPDYKKFVAKFGGGTIEGSIGILVPIETADPMIRRVYRLLDSVREDPDLQRWSGVEGATPSLGDVLIWGDTDSADFIGWLTIGENSETWPLVVYSRVKASWSLYECGMSEFLAGILSGEFSECLISDESLMGAGRSRFLHDREEERLLEMGVYPWEEE